MSLILNKPHLLVHIPIFAPRYKKGRDEWEALVARYKVDAGSPIFIVDWAKAKHMQGRRSAMLRSKAQTYPLESNGKIDCYVIPVDDFEYWESAEEVRDIVNNLKWPEEARI